MNSKHSNIITLVLTHATAIVAGFVIAILLMLLFPPVAVIPDSALGIFEITHVTFYSNTVLVQVKAVTPTTFWYVTIENTVLPPTGSMYSCGNPFLSWNKSTVLRLSYHWAYETQYHIIVKASRRSVSTTVVTPKKPLPPLQPVEAHYSIRFEVSIIENATYADWNLDVGVYHGLYKGGIRKLPFNESISIMSLYIPTDTPASLVVTYYNEASAGLFVRVFQKTFYVQVTVTYS